MRRISFLVLAFLLAAIAAASAQTSPPAKPTPKPAPAKVAAPLTAPTPPPPAAPCPLLPADLRETALRIAAENPIQDAFTHAVNTHYGLPKGAFSMLPGVVVTDGTDLIAVFDLPFPRYRIRLSEAMRRMDPLADVPVTSDVRVTITPLRFEAPDVVKVVIQVNGQQVPPAGSTLAPKEFRNRTGGAIMLHDGAVSFPCSAFTPDARVRITIIPSAGDNVVYEFSPAIFATLFPATAKK